LSDSQSSFSAFWRAEYAISDHSTTGLFNSMIFDVPVLGLEISAKNTSFSFLTQIARLVKHEYHI